MECVEETGPSGAEYFIALVWQFLIDETFRLPLTLITLKLIIDWLLWFQIGIVNLNTQPSLLDEYLKFHVMNLKWCQYLFLKTTEYSEIPRFDQVQNCKYI